MSRSKTVSIAIAASLSAAAGAAASERGEATPPARTSPVAPQPEAPAALSEEEMQALSGGDAVNVEVLTRQQLSGTTTGNTVSAGSITSGSVNFSPDALSGFNGVGNFVINTGANNTLQGAISISIVTTPGS